MPRETTAQDLDTRLAAVLSRFPEVAAGYLFGSHATGRVRPDSDIDLAIVPDTDDEPGLKLDLAGAFIAAGLDNVDLVFLSSRDLFMRYEAVHVNHPVYTRQDFEHGTYFSRALREYWDFEPYLAIQRAALKERLTGHG